MSKPKMNETTAYLRAVSALYRRSKRDAFVYEQPSRSASGYDSRGVLVLRNAYRELARATVANGRVRLL